MPDATYEYYKRYRETQAERTAKAYANWNLYQAELEFDRRERLQMYRWLRHYGHIFEETT